jgi:hypothetical protein
MWKIDAALREEAARLPLVVEFRQWNPGPDVEKRAAVEARRSRFRELYAEGEIDQTRWHRERDRADEELADLASQVESVPVATGPLHPKVDWDAEPAALGDQLRRVFRVRLDANMEPSVEWLIPKPKAKRQKSA